MPGKRCTARSRTPPPPECRSSTWQRNIILPFSRQLYLSNKCTVGRSGGSRSSGWSWTLSVSPSGWCGTAGIPRGRWREFKWIYYIFMLCEIFLRQTCLRLCTRPGWPWCPTAGWRQRFPRRRSWWWWGPPRRHRLVIHNIFRFLSEIRQINFYA